MLMCTCALARGRLAWAGLAKLSDRGRARGRLSLLCRQPVRCHPVVVASYAEHCDVLNGSIGAGERKAFGDLSRDAAARARYQRLHVSHLDALNGRCAEPSDHAVSLRFHAPISTGHMSWPSL